MRVTVRRLRPFPGDVETTTRSDDVSDAIAEVLGKLQLPGAGGVFQVRWHAPDGDVCRDLTLPGAARPLAELFPFEVGLGRPGHAVPVPVEVVPLETFFVAASDPVPGLYPLTTLDGVRLLSEPSAGVPGPPAAAVELDGSFENLDDGEPGEPALEGEGDAVADEG